MHSKIHERQECKGTAAEHRAECSQILGARGHALVRMLAMQIVFSADDTDGVDSIVQGSWAFGKGEAHSK